MRIIQFIFCLLLIISTVSFAQLEVTNDEQKNNCIQCHKSSFTSNNNHFIEHSDDCQFCHEVSSREVDHKTITYSSNTLCQSCHFDIDVKQKLLKHESFDCISCHNAHGSDYKYSMINDPVSFCMESCHTKDQLGLSHPVGEGIEDKHAGGEMTCVSTCHTNHQPVDEKMLQLASTDLCGQCHQEKY